MPAAFVSQQAIVRFARNGRKITVCDPFLALELADMVVNVAGTDIHDGTVPGRNVRWRSVHEIAMKHQ